MIDNNNNMIGHSKKGWRKLVMIVAMAIMAMLPMQMRADDIFDALADMQGVESTYVSGRFAHNYKQWNMSGRRLNLNMGFSSLYAYELTSTTAVTKAKRILDQYLQKHPELEVMLRTRDGQSEYIVLEQFGMDNKLYKWVIWDYMASNSLEIVVINWKNGYTREEDK